jgi:ubiquinone/menaquinone biosynthesis C-methylase UbiE
MQSSYIDKTYHNFVKNKKVIVVGAAPHLLNSKQGNFIDSFDLVVRINKGFELTEDMQIDLGTRTDIIYSGVTTQWHIHGKIIPEELKGKVKWICSSNISEGVGTKIEEKFRQRNKNLIPFHTINLQFHKKIMQKLDSYPNSGTTAILDLLLHEVKELYITGFTFFQKRKECNKIYFPGYRPETQYNDPAHNAPRQLEYMKEIVKQDSRIKVDDVLHKILTEETKKDILLKEANKKEIITKRKKKQEIYKQNYSNPQNSFNNILTEEDYKTIKSIDQISSLCDVGCGDGTFCLWVKKNICRSLYGVDFASNFCPVRMWWFKEDAHDIRLPDKYIDYITALNLMEYLIVEDVDFVLQEFCRIAVKGVIFYLTFTLPDSNNILEKKLKTIIKPKSWWINKFEKYGRIKEVDKFIIISLEENENEY